MKTTTAPVRSAKAQSTREKIIDTARRLFDSKGFHSTTTAELAIEAGISIGLIYRHFSSKDDIILTITEQNVEANIAHRDAILDGVKRGALSVFDGIKAIAYSRLTDPEIGLFFEVLTESCRSLQVKERVGTLAKMYREGIQEFVLLARPDATPQKREAYVDLMIACFIGLCYRPAVGIAENPDKTSHEIASLLMTALGLEEPPPRKAATRRTPRAAPKRKTR